MRLFRYAGDDDDMKLIPDGQLSNADGRVEPCSRRGCILLTFIYFLFATYEGIDLLFTGLLYRVYVRPL